MGKQSRTWVFPTVKILVNLAFFSGLALWLLFLGQNASNLLGWSTRSTVNSSPPGYVSVPVTWWSLPDQKNLAAETKAGRIILEPDVRKGTLRVPARSELGVLTLALTLLGGVFFVGLFYLLKRVFDALQPEAPFQPIIAQFIGAMGWLLLIQEGLGFVVRALLQNQAQGYLKAINPAYSTKLTLALSYESTWLLGLILLALAQVYRRGIELQAENELTI